MKLSERVKPISYLEAHAPEVIRDLAGSQDPFIITLDGEAKAVLQDIGAYEQTQESIALLKILAMTSKSVEDGKVRPMRAAFADLQDRVKKARP